MSKLAAALLFCALALPGSSALAQDVECRREGTPPVYRCEPIELHGRLPDTFLLLNRTRDRYEAPPLDRRMVHEIPRTVRRDPF